jgi:hypothetical protein
MGFVSKATPVAFVFYVARSSVSIGRPGLYPALWFTRQCL